MPAFYSRFYSVINAMQQSEDADVTEAEPRMLKRKREAKLDVLGIPTRNRPTTRSSNKSEYVSAIETNLGAMATTLNAIDQALSRYEQRLQQVYIARAKRRRELLGTNSTKPIDLMNDATYQSQVRDARKLEAAIRSRHLTIDSKLHFTIPDPEIASSRTSSRTLDNNIQDLLREPAKGQLKALALLISSTSVAPTVKTFNILISRLTRLRLNAAAWIVLQTMLRLRHPPDAYTISSALNLCIASGSYIDFRKVLSAARLQKRLQRSSATRTESHPGRSTILFSTIIKGCTKFGNMARAETYMKLMRAEKTRPNMEILTALIHGYAERRDWTSGLSHFERILHMDWDRKTVATLISFCRACGKPAFEQRIRVLAESKGIKPTGPDDDIALLPLRWKTKGLDVPDHFKRPVVGDLGAIVVRPGRWPRDKQGDRNKAERVEGSKRSGPVFTGTRKEALGKWAYIGSQGQGQQA